MLLHIVILTASFLKWTPCLCVFPSSPSSSSSSSPFYLSSCGQTPLDVIKAKAWRVAEPAAILVWRRDRVRQTQGEGGGGERERDAQLCLTYCIIHNNLPDQTADSTRLLCLCTECSEHQTQLRLQFDPAQPHVDFLPLSKPTYSFRAEWGIVWNCCNDLLVRVGAVTMKAKKTLEKFVEDGRI